MGGMGGMASTPLLRLPATNNQSKAASGRPSFLANDMEVC
jgi:hypothetical protein